MKFHVNLFHVETKLVYFPSSGASFQNEPMFFKYLPYSPLGKGHPLLFANPLYFAYSRSMNKFP